MEVDIFALSPAAAVDEREPVDVEEPRSRAAAVAEEVAGRPLGTTGTKQAGGSHSPAPHAFGGTWGENPAPTFLLYFF